jgi:hypothetical protein
MFPGRRREGNSCDFGTLRPATQRYQQRRFSAVLAPDDHHASARSGSSRDCLIRVVEEQTAPPANCVSVASKRLS